MTRRAVRVSGWLALPVLAAAGWVAPVPATMVEVMYSRGLYPFLQNGVTFVSNLVPVAVLDVLIVGTVVLAVVRAAALRRRARQVGAPAALWELSRRAVRAVAFVVVVFLVAWGLNYRRVPLADTLEAPAESGTSELLSVMRDANALAASLRGGLPIGAGADYELLAEELRGPMAAALRAVRRPVLFRPGRPKFSLILDPFFTWAGVNGMLNPLGLESIVHADLLPFERGFVLGHEWAHLAGLADEAEASAIGWLACMNGSPTLAYSASLYLILEAGNALPGASRAKAFASLDAGVRADLEQIRQRMMRQRPEVQRAASRVYDEYLKANRVEDGSASYGRALMLILSPDVRRALNEYGTRSGD